jgi:hypothetical protein
LNASAFRLSLFVAFVYFVVPTAFPISAFPLRLGGCLSGLSFQVSVLCFLLSAVAPPPTAQTDVFPQLCFPVGVDLESRYI